MTNVRASARIWATSLAGVLVPIQVLGQAAALAPSNSLEEIVVTAQKREQSASTVGMSITALSGESLRKRGIDSVTELPQMVPGLTVQESAFNSISFTLRGVGFFNSDLGTPPAVTFYQDEAPLPYPTLAQLAAFDVERVEVLKGPQGTLYGQNATGGAVNYIAAKPTDSFEAGVDMSYGRFNRVELGAFAAGPLTDQLSARLAIQGRRGDAWQRSITRPGDRLGEIRALQTRATLEWHADERYLSRVTFSLVRDRSDSLAAQFIAPVSTVPALAVPGLLTFPAVKTPRDADWTDVRLDTNSRFPYDRDTTLYQANWRNDYQLNDRTTFTSLTSYSHSRVAYGQDPDGTPFHLNEVIDESGRISAFFQELRVAGEGEKTHWVVGANYANDDVSDGQVNFVRDNDVCHLFESIDPQAYCDWTLYTGRMRVNTWAAFGRLEYEMVSGVAMEMGVRYNDDRRTFDNCASALTEHLARFWNTFRGGTPPPTEVGRCFIMDPANGLRPVDIVHRELDEDSLSWKVGVNWNADPARLLYANVSKGYKAGTVPVLGGTTVVQYTPVPQEAVLAYEAGIKIGLFERRAQLNAAAFYYEYRDKQLRGSLLDSTFGPLEALVSIPRSHVRGAEAQLVVRPMEGLTFDTSATYVRTQIDRFTGFDALAHFGDQSGTPFPFSPTWQSITNVDYEFSLSASMKAFVGGSLVYNGKTYAGVGALDIQRIDPFTLLDARLGLADAQGRYRLWVWGKNLTNEHYWSNVLPYGNAISRYVGQPATFGVSLSGRF
jgi:iron complex outermembrane recepter protein